MLRFYILTLKGNSRNNLAKLPASYVISGSKWIGWVGIILAVMVGLEPLTQFVQAVMAADFYLLGWVNAIWLVLGCILFVLGLDQLKVTGTLEITAKTVECNYRNLFGTTRWKERISGYKGLKVKKESEKSGVFNAIIYTIWLEHSSKSRSIRISRAGSDLYIEEDLEKYCQMFGLRTVK